MLTDRQQYPHLYVKINNFRHLGVSCYVCRKKMNEEKKRKRGKRVNTGKGKYKKREREWEREKETEPPIFKTCAIKQRVSLKATEHAKRQLGGERK